MNLFIKQKQTHRHRKLMVTQGERGVRDKLGVWDQQIQTTIYKTGKQQGPTYSTGNYIQYLINYKYKRI